MNGVSELMNQSNGVSTDEKLKVASSELCYCQLIDLGMTLTKIVATDMHNI